MLDNEISELLRASLADRMGHMSPAVYDTGHMVRQSAVLPRDLVSASLRWLLRSQHPDGSWGTAGMPEGYRLMPSLGALAALVHAAYAPSVGEDHAQIAAAIERGLGFAARDPDRYAPAALPDLPCLELTLPALLEELTLPRTGPAGASGVEALVAAAQPQLRAALEMLGPYRAGLHKVRASVRAGGEVRVHLAYHMEVLASRAAEPLEASHYASVGLQLDALAAREYVGVSPAATATVAGLVGRIGAPALAYLRHSANRLDGAQPTMMPFGLWDQEWSVDAFVSVGYPLDDAMRRAIVSHFVRELGTDGAGIAGLALDADTNALLFALLHHLGEPADPRLLRAFALADTYACYHGERTHSPTTNAHVLQAYGGWLRYAPDDAATYRDEMAKTVRYVLATQERDGAWFDKWHASPYYAVYHIVPALLAFGGEQGAQAATRALQWVLATQREDGSWGHWFSSFDETGHAVALLASTLRLQKGDEVALRRALHRAGAFLERPRSQPEHDRLRAALWHCKELYEPERIVRALVLAARFACAAYGRP